MNVLEAFCAPFLSDAATEPDWPRPDFRIAHIEFLIGLVAIACPPADLAAWIEGWESPPSPERLAEAFAPYRHAFELDGDGPRFMQDLEELPGEPDLPESLLIEAPGGSTKRNNTALLVKPDRVRVLSRKAAAMALFALQTYAPAGGRGNLTSVRGGGPMTTLALPPATGDMRLDLWRCVWANVPYGVPVPQARLARVLPWLAPTRTADKYPATTDAEADRLQALWGMPRRIRLDFVPNTGGTPCDLTGEIDDVIVTGWRQRPNGVKYVGFLHPLSPHYSDPKSGRLPLHPQPGGIGYRHWLALAIGDDDRGRQRATCIADWSTRAREVSRAAVEETRILACGYDMDNMKARSFVESEMPLPGLRDPSDEARVRTLAKRLVPATETVARALRMTIRDAVLDRDAKVDSAPLAAAYESLWSETQQPFFDVLDEATASDEPPDKASQNWRDRLERTSLRLFDDAASLDPSAASFDFERIVDARRNLTGTLRGYGKLGDELFTQLRLNKPNIGKPKSKRGGKP